MVDERDLKVEIVKRMLRKEYIGRRYGRQRDILSKFSGRKRKKAQKLIQSMRSNPNVPVANYKDKQDAYRLVDAGRAEQFVKSLGGDPTIEDEYDDLRIISP